MGVGRWVPHICLGWHSMIGYSLSGTCMGMNWVADGSDHMLGGNEDDHPFDHYCGSCLQLENEPYEHEEGQQYIFGASECMHSADHYVSTGMENVCKLTHLYVG